LFSLAACGDSGGDGDGDGSSGSSSSTGAVDDDGGPNPTDPETSASATDSTGGGEDSDTGGSSTGGETIPPGTDTGEPPGECGVLEDEAACEKNEACAWVGNVNNGECLPGGADACPDITEMMACSMHPDCDWDNMKMTCGPAA
jgi:hypothetical protein